MLKDFQGKHPNTMTRMDAGGSEKGTIAFMTAMPPHGLGIKMNIVNAVQDKVSRALPLSKIWNEGRLLVPVNKLWVPALTEQIIGFTGSGAEHDDIVDALSSAINALIASQPGDRVATSGKTRSTAKGLTGYSEGSMKRARSVW
jgi:predicted phage terminase large subunit-like protein